MTAEIIISVAAVVIAILTCMINSYWRFRTLKNNDIRHIHQRIEGTEEGLSEIRERMAAVERDITWMKGKCG